MSDERRDRNSRGAALRHETERGANQPAPATARGPARWPGLLVIAAVACVLLLEVLLRWPGQVDVRFKLADKRLHCLSADGMRILLCPDTRVAFEHPFGFDYTITTDARGERIVYTGTTAPPPTGAPAIWIIGDSIAMGYGQNDEDTFAALIARARPDRLVRNLGVDAVGAGGIRAMLGERLEELSGEEDQPTRIFWIMHMSDFIDDVNDIQLAASSGRRLLRRLHFFASRHSALYNLLKVAGEKLSLSRQRNDYREAAPEPKPGPAIQLPPEDHPTFAAIERTIELVRERELDLVFVFYPNIDHATGSSLADYSLERMLMSYIRARGGGVHDTRWAFLRAGPIAELYLPRDGHPAPSASKVFAREILKLIP